MKRAISGKGMRQQLAGAVPCLLCLEHRLAPAPAINYLLQRVGRGPRVVQVPNTPPSRSHPGHSVTLRLKQDRLRRISPAQKNSRKGA
jgi:hypothetical protein